MNTRIDTLPLERAIAGMRRGFHMPATLLARAPARVNLIGEHTDYNEGWAMPCAIDRDTVVAAAPRDDDVIEVLACDLDNERIHFRVDQAAEIDQSPQWLRYVRGMVAVLRGQGLDVGGANLAIAGNVPQGAGLSSSASLEMAVGQALQHLNGWELDPGRMARLGQRAENEFAGCRCGVLDQMASAFGRTDHALLLDCRSLTTEAVPIPVGLAVVVVDSKIPRGLVDTEYNLRRQQCEAAARELGVPALRDVDESLWAAKANQLDPLLRRRARHIVTDSQRCAELAVALKTDNRGAIASVMRASHESMRDDFQITVPGIDALARLMQDVLRNQGGARMTGGGFGGCLVALAPTDAVPDLQEAINQHYRSPQGHAAEIHFCRAADGAGLIV